jgi:hypothetical protein
LNPLPDIATANRCKNDIKCGWGDFTLPDEGSRRSFPFGGSPRDATSQKRLQGKRKPKRQTGCVIAEFPDSRHKECKGISEFRSGFYPCPNLLIINKWGVFIIKIYKDEKEIYLRLCRFGNRCGCNF